jgi:hypothetical protein
MIKGNNVHIKIFFFENFSKKKKCKLLALSHSSRSKMMKKKIIAIQFGKYTQPYYFCTKINNIMANIRNLKKDVDFLTNDVISDAFLALGFHGEKVEEKVSALLEEVVDFHNQTYEKINSAPTGRKKSETKPYFRNIRTEMDKKYREFFEKLSEIISNK